jgi:uncharacterized membrane protein
MACSPFAIFLSSETRMYSLVIALTLMAACALARMLEQPTWPRAAALSGTTAALLLSHYWALFLTATTLALLTMLASGRPALRRQSLSAAAAVAGGCMLFLPWWPVFSFQLRHTGTPWAAPPSARTVSTVLADWSAPAQTAGFRGLPPVSAALVVPVAAMLGLLVVCAVAGGGRSRASGAVLAARLVAVAAAAALLVSCLASAAGHGGYEPRYTAAVFALVIVVAGIGAARLSPRRRRAVLAALCVAGLTSSAAVQTQPSKTQASAIARTIRSGAHSGDVVVYCPDQLAPAVSRLLPHTLRQQAFPAGATVATVDWVNYGVRNRAASPDAFATTVLRVARGVPIWLVDVPHGYATFGDKCARLRLLLSHGRVEQARIRSRPHAYYEFANLLELTPEPQR